MTAAAAAPSQDDRAALIRAMQRELLDAAMEVARIVGGHACVQAEEFGAGFGQGGRTPARRGPPPPRTGPHASAAPQPPRLGRRIDWVTLFCRTSAEVVRLINLEYRDRLRRSRPLAAAELKPGRVRRLIGDAVLADPGIAAIGRKVAGIEQRLVQAAVDEISPPKSAPAKPPPAKAGSAKAAPAKAGLACIALRPRAPAPPRPTWEPASPRRIDWKPAVETLRQQIKRKLAEVRGPPPHPA